MLKLFKAMSPHSCPGLNCMPFSSKYIEILILPATEFGLVIGPDSFYLGSSHHDRICFELGAKTKSFSRELILAEFFITATGKRTKTGTLFGNGAFQV